MEDNETSLILKNVNDNQTENQNHDVISREDFAWADSCLIEDPEISETNMNSLKEALLDILDQHSEIFGSSSNYLDNSYDVSNPENLTSVIEEGTARTAETSIVGELEEEREESHDVLSILKQQPFLDQNSEIFGSFSNYFDNSYDITNPENLTSVIEEGTARTAETSIVGELEEEREESQDVLSILKQQPFLPTYNDEMMNVQYSDNDDDGFVSSELAMEPLSDDIFKVWDLDIQVEEEDELDIQLKEALTSNAATRVPKKKGLKLESVDNLVASIAGLSIK